MHTLLPLAEQVAILLKARRETISIAESSSEGLIAAALLAVPSASAHFLGKADRVANMHAFAAAALELLQHHLSQ